MPVTRSGAAAASPWKAEREHPTRHDKKAAVVLAAARLFTRQGFQGTSLDDVARSLGVSKPTLYYYVDSKEQILFDCARHGVDALRHAVADGRRQALGPRALLQHALQQLAAIVTSDHGLCVIRVGEEPLSEARRRELRDLKAGIDAEVRGLIAEAMADGSIVAGDAHVAAYTAVGAIGAVGRWYRPEEHGAAQLQQAIDHCIGMLMRGVLEAPASTRAQAQHEAAPPSPADPRFAQRRELHFGQRLLRCFAHRPPHLAHMLARAVAEVPEAEALVCGDLRLTWRALHHAATRCAGGLAARGVQPGDRLVLMLPNQPEFVVVALACAWLGAVLVPYSHRAGATELRLALADAEAVALVCLPEHLALLPAPEELPALRLRLVAAPRADAPCEPLAALMQATPLEAAHVPHEEDLAVLMYTSGTTGRPKGSMLTHLNIAHSVMHFEQAMSLAPGERTLIAVPLSHVTGLVAQLYTQLHARGGVVLMPQFKAAEFLALMAQERVSHTILVPAMYNLCLMQPELGRLDLSAWRLGAYGGAAMPVATIEALAERLPGLVLMNAYGATETCSPATIMPAGATASHRDSVGRPVACGELMVADDQGRELPPGEVGEIWIAGPMVVPGYWRNEAATAAEFSGGWWRSGDLGTQDAQGYVRVLDRKKDVINRGGYKVFCVTVENALAEHPQVLESALVGVPCTVLGERVHAYVCVRTLDEATQARALARFCAERVADYAVPETWTIGTEPLPRNANGKVVKRALRERLPAALS